VTPKKDLLNGSKERFCWNLTDEQRQRLLDIANRCPVHRTLTSEIRVETRLIDDLLSERMITALLSNTKAENDVTDSPRGNR